MSNRSRLRAWYELRGAGITHDQVAREAGVSRVFVTLVLTGQRRCPDHLAAVIRRLLAETDLFRAAS